jgi:hypothetical protein
MSKENGLTPREDCAWTEERCEQFRNLERLLNSVSMLNHSTNFLGNAQQCIEIADHLRKWDMDLPAPSFMDFLRDQIIEDRFPKGGAA